MNYRYYSNGKLKSWIDKHCIVCGKFVSKGLRGINIRHGIMCHICALRKNRNKYLKKHYHNDKEYRNYKLLEKKIWYNIEKINIGDYV